MPRPPAPPSRPESTEPPPSRLVSVGIRPSRVGKRPTMSGTNEVSKPNSPPDDVSEPSGSRLARLPTNGRLASGELAPPSRLDNGDALPPSNERTEVIAY